MKLPVKQRRADYQVVPYPVYQRLGAAASRSVRHRPLIHGLFDADVTRARAALRARKARTGEALSFTAFLATCVAKAVDESKAVQAFRQGGKRLVLFEDVDISTRIEREVSSQKYVVPHIIRAANRKTFRELHDEIRAAQSADVTRALTRFRLLPSALYRLFFWAFAMMARRRPRLWKMTVGTVGLTPVGMFGRGAGWGIPATSPTALMVTVGGIGEKQAVVDGRPAIREYLSLTVSVDHDLVDGAPAARFTRRLKELIESGYGLSDLIAEAEGAGADGAPQRQAESFQPALP
ncbi:MAG TPA: 2-oxo acid dehydrogenase subunit E2 [Ktedonobacterales bacterium]|nr:2-oxo acid dehydrogenase subunit E2 [Ktedonobacterales bacterium]